MSPTSPNNSSSPTRPSTRPRARPSLRAAHPLRIGKSLRHRAPNRRTPRELLLLKFPHIPEGTSLSSPGQLVRDASTLSVELPANRSGHTQVFSGSCRTLRRDSAMSDYALVFVNGEFWLERIADCCNYLRAGEVNAHMPDAITHPNHVHDDAADDPDSWMANADDESGSPITPPDDDPDDRAPTTTAPATVPNSSATPAPNTAAPATATKTLPSNGSASVHHRPSSLSIMPSRPALQSAHAVVADKCLPGKTVAGKGVSHLNGSSASAANAERRMRPGTADDDDLGGDEEKGVKETDDVSSLEISVAPDVESEKDSKSSSSDDSSDSATDTDDSDSPDYTSGSSDED